MKDSGFCNKMSMSIYSPLTLFLFPTTSKYSEPGYIEHLHTLNTFSFPMSVQCRQVPLHTAECATTASGKTCAGILKLRFPTLIAYKGRQEKESVAIFPKSLPFLIVYNTVAIAFEHSINLYCMYVAFSWIKMS